jgi:hypothetical protein
MKQAKKSGMPFMKGQKGVNPFGKAKSTDAKKPTKKFAAGGMVSSDMQMMGRNMAKAKNQK